MPTVGVADASVVSPAAPVDPSSEAETTLAASTAGGSSALPNGGTESDPVSPSFEAKTPLSTPNWLLPLDDSAQPSASGGDMSALTDHTLAPDYYKGIEHRANFCVDRNDVLDRLERQVHRQLRYTVRRANAAEVPTKPHMDTFVVSYYNSESVLRHVTMYRSANGLVNDQVCIFVRCE